MVTRLLTVDHEKKWGVPYQVRCNKCEWSTIFSRCPRKRPDRNDRSYLLGDYWRLRLLLQLQAMPNYSPNTTTTRIKISRSWTWSTSHHVFQSCFHTLTFVLCVVCDLLPRPQLWITTAATSTRTTAAAKTTHHRGAACTRGSAHQIPRNTGARSK